MKKGMLFILFILLLPEISFARGNTLYEIAENTITLAEKTITCTAPGGLCSEADAIFLKAEAENGLRDFVGLVKSGNLRSMKLSNENIRRLTSRLESLQSQLVHVGMFETACNYGFVLLNNSVFLIKAGMFYLIIPPMGILFLVLGILGIPVACLVLLSCFFWWL